MLSNKYKKKAERLLENVKIKYMDIRYDFLRGLSMVGLSCKYKKTVFEIEEIIRCYFL